jgi:outer membrane lipoprotein-sorting protein
MAPLRNGLLAALLLPFGSALAVEAPAIPAAAPMQGASPAEASNNFSFARYRADYVVDADAGNTQAEHYDILLKTRSAVDQFSQVRLSYSEKMETLEVLEAYTLTALINPALLEQQYDLSEEAAPRDGLQWLSLTPKRETEASFQYAALGFNASGLAKMEITDAVGQRTVIAFTGWKRNPSFAAGTFRFTPPAGTDVIGE